MYFQCFRTLSIKTQQSQGGKRNSWDFCCGYIMVFVIMEYDWIFIGRTDAEAETPILWPPDARNWLSGKDPDAGKDWRQEEKGTTEDEMVGWHHWLDGHEFEQTPGAGEGQGNLACCSPWGHKELDTTEWLNWLNWWLILLTFTHWLVYLAFFTKLHVTWRSSSQVDPKLSG